MRLPKEKILFKSPFHKELETLLNFAEKALSERAAIWSPFISAQLIEEVKDRFNNLNDISLLFEGGFPSAERKRICFLRSEEEFPPPSIKIPIKIYQNPVKSYLNQSKSDQIIFQYFQNNFQYFPNNFPILFQ